MTALFRWAITKMQDSSATLCAKDLLLHLERVDTTERAMVLILAESFVRNGDADFKQLLTRPLSTPSSVARKTFSDLSDATLGTQAQNDNLLRQMKRAGNTVPKYAAQHFIRVRFAAQVWCVTIAAGFSKTCFSHAQKIWSLLNGSRPNIPTALRHLKEIEQLTARDTGMRVGEMFGELTLDIVTAPVAPCLDPELARLHHSQRA